MNTDEQIVEAVKGGGTRGQSLMVSRYCQQVFAMIVRQVGDTILPNALPALKESWCRFFCLFFKLSEMRMKQVIKHRDTRPLKMIRRTVPVIPD